MTNFDSELTAGLFCVAGAWGRAHFTSDRRTAHNDAADVRDAMRAAGCPGVHNVRAQWLDGNTWRDCRAGR